MLLPDDATAAAAPPGIVVVVVLAAEAAAAAAAATAEAVSFGCWCCWCGCCCCGCCWCMDGMYCGEDEYLVLGGWTEGRLILCDIAIYMLILYGLHVNLLKCWLDFRRYKRVLYISYDENVKTIF